MPSSASDPSLGARVAAALTLGRAEQPARELAFVVTRLTGDHAGGHDVDGVLAALADGVCPYHVFGEYPLPGTTATIGVPRTVMPPGSVTPAVIDTVTDLVRRRRPGRVVDLGCGTGVLGIAALLADPDARAILVDIDPAAVACARDNLTRLHLAHRASAVLADGLAGIAAGSVDLLIANLPFVPDADIAALPARFRRHAPPRAIRGGPDGLALFRTLLPAIHTAAAGNATLILQLGDGQKASVAGLLGPHWEPATGSDGAHPNILVAHRRPGPAPTDDRPAGGVPHDVA